MGIERIKDDGLDRSHRIGEWLAALLFATAGAIIARCFYATRKTDDAEGPPRRAVLGASSGPG
jgi:hypothetical protein